jgi:hypothetical protein
LLSLRLRALDCIRIVKGERQSESRVEVCPDADRVGLLLEKINILFHDGVDQRLQCRKPSLGIRVVPRVKLFVELQKPCPPVWTLERCPAGGLKIIVFNLDIIGAEVSVQSLPDISRFREGRVEP